MIAWLEGVLREKAPGRVVVDVRGVGYELRISLPTFAQLPDVGKTISLYVKTVAREDALILFGFATSEERDAFELLVRANRVGPKLAQTILSGIESERLLAGLRDGDVGLLSSAPGVGKKLAERMVVDLRERAAQLALEHGASRPATGEGIEAAGHAGDTREQVRSALVNLGYSRPQAEKVVLAVAAEVGEGASIEEWIRVALRRLAP